MADAAQTVGNAAGRVVMMLTMHPSPTPFSGWGTCDDKTDRAVKNGLRSKEAVCVCV
jgi:hypothetical protein